MWISRFTIFFGQTCTSDYIAQRAHVT